LQIKGQEM